ncbi:MAG: hypothetical protein RIR29_504 [Actinomycetota bacterium]
MFCFGLIAVLALSSEVERNIRGHYAALSIANETLRSFQLLESETSAFSAAQQAAKTFGLPAADFEVFIRASCSAQGDVKVMARVREIEEVANGRC